MLEERENGDGTSSLVDAAWDRLRICRDHDVGLRVVERSGSITKTPICFQPVPSH